MRNVRITTTASGTKEVITSIDVPVREIFSQNGFDPGTCQIYVDGEDLHGNEAMKTLRELGYNDEDDFTIFINAIFMAKNA